MGMIAEDEEVTAKEVVFKTEEAERGVVICDGRTIGVVGRGVDADAAIIAGGGGVCPAITEEGNRVFRPIEETLPAVDPPLADSNCRNPILIRSATTRG